MVAVTGARLAEPSEIERDEARVLAVTVTLAEGGRVLLLTVTPAEGRRALLLTEGGRVLLLTVILAATEEPPERVLVVVVRELEEDELLDCACLACLLAAALVCQPQEQGFASDGLKNEPC